MYYRRKRYSRFSKRTFGIRRRTGGYRRSRITRRKGFLPRGRRTRIAKLSKSIQRSPFTADCMYVKLRYHDIIAMQIYNDLSTTTYVYSGNSIADPDFSNVGHRPYGFDQWKNLYSNCVVLGSSIHLKCLATLGDTTQSAGTACNIRVQVVPVDSTTSCYTTYGGTAGLPEIPRSRTTDINFYNAPKHLQHYSRSNTVFGVPAIQVSTDSAFSQSTLTTNPGKQWYWQILATSPDIGLLSPMANFLSVEVSICYYAKLFHRINPVAESVIA